ncbi:hypothetical protein F5B18DRAFT_607645 [Nemania serpens]|nr:hypothetical protein F5B18DRAFT_607645 [Nemania serpens]
MGLGDTNLAEMDSADERRRQLEGYKAEFSQNWRETERAEACLGSGTLAEFEAAAERLSSIIYFIKSDDRVESENPQLHAKRAERQAVRRNMCR